MKLINIGFGNMVSAGRLIAIVSPESAPIKRMVQEARDRGVLVDATYGRRTRAVLITDSDHIILSGFSAAARPLFFRVLHHPCPPDRGAGRGGLPLHYPGGV